MRIVHYLSSMDLKDGGVVRALLDLCPALARVGGHEVVLLTCRDVDVPSSWREGERYSSGGSIRCVQIGALGRLNRLTSSAVERATLEIRSAQVVHVHGMWALSNDQIAECARRLGVAYVWSPHGMLDDWCMGQRALKKRLFLALREGSLLRRAAIVHCTARAELEQASKWFASSNPAHAQGRVVPLIFDLSPFSELPGPELAHTQSQSIDPAWARGTSPIVLFLSRLHPKKGVETLLRAGAILKSEGSPIRVIVAGSGDPGYGESLRRLASELGIEGEVLFPGFVSGALKLSMYQSAAVFCLPSSQENFGFVVVESLMCKTPVVTTRGVATWPEIEQSGGGAIAGTSPEVSPTDLVRTLTPWLADPGKRRAAGEAGRAFVARWLDEARIVEAFTRMYGTASQRGR